MHIFNFSRFQTSLINRYSHYKCTAHHSNRGWEDCDRNKYAKASQYQGRGKGSNGRGRIGDWWKRWITIPVVPFQHFAISCTIRAIAPSFAIWSIIYVTLRWVPFAILETANMGGWRDRRCKIVNMGKSWRMDTD